MQNPRRILVVDNYDSFVFNLVGYLEQLGAECERRPQRRGDRRGDRGRFDGVLLSPGPGTPEEAGVSMAMVAAVRGEPACRCSACASATRRSGSCSARRWTGRRSCCTARRRRVHHDGTGVLEGLPSPFTATRYHSLAIDPETLPDELMVTGRTDAGVIMAVRHRDLPLHGRPVPPRERPHRGRAPDARQLPR